MVTFQVVCMFDTATHSSQYWPQHSGLAGTYERFILIVLLPSEAYKLERGTANGARAKFILPIRS